MKPHTITLNFQRDPEFEEACHVSVKEIITLSTAGRGDYDSTVNGAVHRAGELCRQLYGDYSGEIGILVQKYNIRLLLAIEHGYFLKMPENFRNRPGFWIGWINRAIQETPEVFLAEISSN